jgi:hypothetical protein
MERLFVETPGFDADRAALEKAGELVDDDLAKMEQEIMENPRAGDLVKSSGGLRKIRVGLSARRRGKSYGARVLYLELPNRAVVGLVAIFGKNEKAGLSRAEIKALAALVRWFKENGL